MILGHGRNKTSAQTFPQGCSLIRLHDSGVNWSQLEPAKGQFNWAPLDARLAEAEAHGVKVMYVFSNTPAWTAQPVAGAPVGLPSPLGNCPARLEDELDFTEELLDHVGDGISYFGLWNEWNYPPFYCGTQAQMLTSCEYRYGIIKSRMPQAVVLTPSITYSWAQNNILTALPPMLDAGFQRFADGLAIHGYLAAGMLASGIGPVLDGVHALLTKHNLAMPIWDTEWGFGTQPLTDQQKAQFVSDGLIARLERGVAGACWYAWDDTTHGTMCNPNGTLTAAGQAWLDTWTVWHA